MNHTSPTGGHATYLVLIDRKIALMTGIQCSGCVAAVATWAMKMCNLFVPLARIPDCSLTFEVNELVPEKRSAWCDRIGPC